MAQARLEWPFGFAWRCAIVARSLRRRLSCGIISRADATLWPIGSGSDERGPMDGTASALLFPASMFRPGLPLPIHENAGVPRPRKARREIGNYPLSSGGNLSAAIFAAAIKLSKSLSPCPWSHARNACSASGVSGIARRSDKVLSLMSVCASIFADSSAAAESSTSMSNRLS